MDRTQSAAVAQVAENDWVAFPGGELEGERPKALCPACRAALKRRTPAAGARPPRVLRYPGGPAGVPGGAEAADAVGGPASAVFPVLPGGPRPSARAAGGGGSGYGVRGAVPV